MEELLEKYKKECDIIPRMGSIILKIGIIVILIQFILSFSYNKNLIINFIILLIEMFLVYLICYVIHIKKAKKVLKIKSKTTLKELNIKIDNFQKEWIIRYCKKNKLNRIEKINILRDEIKIKREGAANKYIDPVIIGTLFLNVWGISVEILNNELEFINMLSISIALIFSLSVLIGLWRKEFKENKEFINTFEEKTGLKRLDELLVEVALKCNK